MQEVASHPVVIASEAYAIQSRIVDCRATLAMTKIEVAMDIPDGWTLDHEGAALLRSYRFADFAEAFAFLTRVADHAEAVDHHPEFTSVWNRVDFRLTSHDAGGVTARDIDLAKVIDALVATSAKGGLRN